MTLSIHQPATAGDAPGPDGGPGAGRIGDRSMARLAGWGYVAIFLLALFANFSVVEGLVVDGDAAATTANVEQNLTLFRIGLLAFLAVFLIDIVLAWALHGVFRVIDRDLSLLAAWCRLTYTAFLGVGLVFFFRVLHLLDGPAATTGRDRAAVEADVLAALDAFDATWMIGLAAFGLHLLLLALLVLGGRVAHPLLGWLLLAAGLAYIGDTAVRALVADRGAADGPLLALVAVPSVLGEGWLGLWLLLRGIPASPRPGVAPSPRDAAAEIALGATTDRD